MAAGRPAAPMGAGALAWSFGSGTARPGGRPRGASSPFRVARRHRPPRSPLPLSPAARWLAFPGAPA
eukprot:9564318-Alexandrium_andersonii.AAC.1